MVRSALTTADPLLVSWLEKPPVISFPEPLPLDEDVAVLVTVDVNV